MGVVYSGSTIVNTAFTTGATAGSHDWLTAVKPAMVSAGWTESPAVAASAVLTFAGQPAANDTITLDSTPYNRTYTFKSSLTGAANEVLIDVGGVALTIQHLQAAINAAAGAGTAYGTGTTAHLTMTASAVTSTTLTVTYLTAGDAGNGAPVSKSGANLSWGTSTLVGGYYLLLSAITPAGLQCSVKMYTALGSFYNPGTTLQVYIGDRYQIHQSSANITNSSGGGVPTNTNYRVIASKYQVFVFAVGTRQNQTPGFWFMAGVPYIPSFLIAPVVTAATNANPIVCTIANHGWTTGQSVLIQGALGNTAMNGTNVITVVDANTFSIPVAGNGTYTASSAQASNLTIGDTIVEAIFGDGTGSGNPDNFGSNSSASSAGQYTCVNGQQLTFDSSIAKLQLVVNRPAAISNGAVQWYNNNFVLTEPLLAWGVSTAATPKVVGQMWDTVMVRKDLNLEQSATFDGHNWIAINSSATVDYSLLIATT